MSREATREAINYLQHMKKIMCEEHLKLCPKGTVAYYATIKEKELYDMAINALEENEGLKAQIKGYEHDTRVFGARTEVLLVANKAVNEKIQKAREELQSYTGVEVRGVETIPKVHVLEILDKYLGGDTHGSHE